MSNKTINNLAAALVNDLRYTEIKAHIYEQCVNSDYKSVVNVFKTFEALALEAVDNQFYAGDKPKAESAPDKPFVDPDLDTSLTEEEQKSRL